jgi:WD40 repeat protein/mono/diheme cytochrome c family protein
MKLFLLALGVLLTVSAGAAPVSYRKQIAPIMAANCNACHNEKNPQSGLSTASFAALAKGGKLGRSVIPRNAEASLLVHYIEGRKMPKMPIGGSLKPAEIKLIRQWIDEGAKADGEAAPGGAPAGPAIKVRAGILPQIGALAWSKDGKTLAAGTYRQVRLFSAETGKPGLVLAGHADVVRSLAFSPDGTLLAAAGGTPGEGGEVKLWEAASGRLVKTLTGHADSIFGVAWRGDGKQLATTSYDKTVKLWDVDKGTAMADLKDHADAVYAVGYSASGKYLATASADRSVRVWDPATGKRLYTLAGHTEMVTALAFNPAADQLATGGADKAMRLWNLKADSGDAVRTFQGQPDVITDIRFASDGKSLYSASNDGSVRVWDPGKAEPRKTFSAIGDAVLALAVSPDGATLATGGYDGSVKLYKTADYSLAASLIDPPKTAGVAVKPPAKPAK